MARELLNGAPDPATPPAPEASDDQRAVAPADVQPDSSPADGVTADSPAATDVDPAESSPANGVDRQSLLDVTRTALEIGKPKDGQGSQPKDGQDTGDPASDPTPTPQDPASKKQPATSEDNLSSEADDDFADADKLEFGKHPRFKKLLSQWSRDREPARQFRQVSDFMDEHGLSSDEAAQALKLAALLRHAQRGSGEHAQLFLKDVTPVVAQLRQLLGEEIAPDLQERMAGGSIDEPTAKELTTQRAKANAAERVATETSEQRQAREVQELVQGVQTAVSEWDAGVRTRDPDFSRKEKLIYSTVQRLVVEEGRPRTPRAAVALAQKAYDEVNKAFEGLEAPRPTATTSTRTAARTTTSSVPRTQVRPQPTTPADITRLALARSRTAP